MEKVSIIVPVYNAEKYICRCVNSIINQDYQNLEVILVNDGSTDETKEILDGYTKKDSRIKVIHKVNGGVSSSRNQGLAEATGKYIQFVDADDWLTTESTKLLVKSIETDSSDMAIGAFYRVVGENQSLKSSITNKILISRQEYANRMLKKPANLYYGVVWNKLYRRSIIENNNITMDEKISMSEDMIFNLEYLLHVSTVSVLNEPVYYYVRTPNSLVAKNTNLKKIFEMKKNVITYYDNFYKEILSPSAYIERIPVIYSYLVSISTDSFALKDFKKNKNKSKTK